MKDARAKQEPVPTHRGTRAGSGVFPAASALSRRGRRRRSAVSTEPPRAAGGDDANPSPQLPEVGVDLRDAVESFENQLIVQALERTRWNKKQAARLLGLNRTTLVEMLKRKGIEPGEP
jgi:transcriptional regulator with GAF, ATPase, and Fis domain